MARGKIQIKLIENSTNRQVTYSKRRNGLFKKARELTVLCDAKVSILMLSGTGKIHEYISPSITTKQVIDQYQKALDVDIWSSHYERMKENFEEVSMVNSNMRKEIRQRMEGEDLDHLSFQDLLSLEQEMEAAVKIIRERKLKVIDNQIGSSRKKIRNAEMIKRNLVHALDARSEDPHYGWVDNVGEYDTIIEFQNAGPRIFSLRLQPTHTHSSNLHSGAGSDLTTYHLLD